MAFASSQERALSHQPRDKPRRALSTTALLAFGMRNYDNECNDTIQTPRDLSPMELGRSLSQFHVYRPHRRLLTGSVVARTCSQHSAQYPPRPSLDPQTPASTRS